MTLSHRNLAVISRLAAAALWTGAAIAEPVALALEASGDIDPPLAAFDELEAGAVLRLAPEAEATILHYAECVERQVRGGLVIASPTGLRVGGGGAVLQETAQPCPSRVAFDAGPTAPAATVFRGDGPPLALAPLPRLVFVGPRRGAAARATLERDGVVALTLAVADGAARAPEGAAPLPAGDGYVLVVETDGGTLRIPARIAEAAGLSVLTP